MTLAACATWRPPNRTRAADFRQRHLGCGRARSQTERPVSPALACSAGLVARLAAWPARDSRRRVRKPGRPLRQRDDRAEPRQHARGAVGHRARSHRAAASDTRSRVRRHAPVAGDRERALHAARALRRCAGLAGNGARARPGAGSARRVPRQPHVSRAAALRPEVRRRQEADDAPTCARRSSACWIPQRTPRARALFRDLLGSEAFADGSAPHLRGVRANRGQVTFTLKRSDPAFLARLAMPLACVVPSGTPHRAVPGLLAREATGRYRVRRALLLGDRPAAREHDDRRTERWYARCGGDASRSRGCPMRRR